jgi:hypothetical protein
MKANELRIGNKFYLPNGKVGTISYHEIRLMIVALDKPNYQPIPLTEEWLVKFGFVVEGDDLCLDAGRLIFMWYNDDEFVHLINFLNLQVKRTDTILSIQYVHQLQNLYFALTGEELTFKSE